MDERRPARWTWQWCRRSRAGGRSSRTRGRAHVLTRCCLVQISGDQMSDLRHLFDDGVTAHSAAGLTDFPRAERENYPACDQISRPLLVNLCSEKKPLPQWRLRTNMSNFLGSYCRTPSQIFAIKTIVYLSAPVRSGSAADDCGPGQSYVRTVRSTLDGCGGCGQAAHFELRSSIQFNSAHPTGTGTASRLSWLPRVSAHP
jgi:hypothetical protein